MTTQGIRELLTPEYSHWRHLHKEFKLMITEILKNVEIQDLVMMRNSIKTIRQSFKIDNIPNCLV